VSSGEVADEDGGARVVQHVLADRPEHRADPAQPACAEDDRVVVAGLDLGDDLGAGVAVALDRLDRLVGGDRVQRGAHRPLGGAVGVALHGDRVDARPVGHRGALGDVGDDGEDRQAGVVALGQGDGHGEREVGVAGAVDGDEDPAERGAVGHAHQCAAPATDANPGAPASAGRRDGTASPTSTATAITAAVIQNTVV
jgi:hypothetical protein